MNCGDQSLRLLITGGGTGGHLFPGIALAQGVKSRYPASEVLFIGTDRHVDRVALGRVGFETRTIRAEGVKGKTVGETLRALFLLPVSLFQAAGLIRRFRPDVVFGVGGYVTGPVLLAARLMGCPTCIHEQNSIPGIANRILGRLVDRVFLSLPGSEKFFPPAKTVLTGNPVRGEILAPPPARDPQAPLTLAVLGGSQGARAVNRLMVEAMEKIASRLPAGLRLIHQTGAADRDMVRHGYQRLGLEAEVEAFFTDMAGLYQRADLVVARAGATTLAELMVRGLPAIFIPYPYAADNHQAENARYAVEAGAALVHEQAGLTPEILGRDILALLADGDRRAEMARRAAALAMPRATDRILEECLALLAGRSGGSGGCRATPA